MRKVRERDLRNVVFKPNQPRDQLALSLAVPDAHLVATLAGRSHCPQRIYGVAAAGWPLSSLAASMEKSCAFFGRHNAGFQSRKARPKKHSHM